MTFANISALSADQLAVQQLAREFAAKEVAPIAAQLDREARFDDSLVGKLGALGFLGMLIPEQYEGLGLDTLSYLLALEEIAAVDASAAVLMSVHNSLPTSMLLGFGSEAQKKRWLTPMAHGNLLGAFALSEPEAGSDAAALRTQAVRDGDHWVLNGTKSWVTNGNVAGVILAMARTDTPDARKKGRGISAFIITPDLPGFSVSKKEDKLGLRASPTVQLIFDDMRIPADRLLGTEGDGFTYALQSLENGRMGIAAQAIGIAQAALDLSIAYAAERKQFGTLIRDFQGVQFKLADMATRITAARALLHATAAAKDRGEQVGPQTSMSKLFASETAMWVTTNAIQIFGGYGFIKDFAVERLFRDAKVTEIYEGTSEIQRIVIGRSLAK